MLLGGVLLWYGPVTDSAQNLSQFLQKLSHDGLNVLPNRRGGIINAYLNGNNVASVSARAFQRLARESYRSRRAYIHPLAVAGSPRFDLRDITVTQPRTRLPALGHAWQLLSTVFAEIMLVLAVLGSIVMAIRSGEPPMRRRLGILAVSTVGILLLIRFSGTIAASYNQSRALMQALLLLAIPAVGLVVSVGARLRARRSLRPVANVVQVLMLCTLPLMLAYSSSLSAVITGGGTFLNLSSSGDDYQEHYTEPAELTAAAWAAQKSGGRLLYSDTYGQLRLENAAGAVALTLVTPQTLDRSAWVYGTSTNVELGIAHGGVGGKGATYRWPAAFLSDEFDLMYDDGASRVFHR